MFFGVLSAHSSTIVSRVFPETCGGEKEVGAFGEVGRYAFIDKMRVLTMLPHWPADISPNNGSDGRRG